MTEEWEYMEEAIAEQSKKDYINSCPVCCLKCRWLDTYYETGCTMNLYPVNNKCLGYTNEKNYKRFKWFGHDLNWQWWKLKMWLLKKLGFEPNYVGSWRQWEYSENYQDYDEEDY